MFEVAGTGVVTAALAAVRLKRMGEQDKMPKRGVESTRELRVRTCQLAIARPNSYVGVMSDTRQVFSYTVLKK